MDEKFMELASEIAEAEITQALKDASRRAIPSSDKLLEPHEYKAEDCEECGAPLIEFRKQRGLTICTECKSAQEKMRKHYAP